MSKIHEFGIVWYSVSNLEKSLVFYTKKLGLTLDFALPEIGWAQFADKVGTSRFGIAEYPTRKKKIGHHGGTVVFVVKNLKKIEANLKRKKVKTDPVIEIPGLVRILNVHDPDGNIIQLDEILAKK